MSEKSFLINSKLRIINSEKFEVSFKRFLKGQQEIVEIHGEDFVLQQNDIGPLEGYEISEDFPLCCKPHKEIYEGVQGYFQRFPDCCEKHRLLNEEKWFVKEDYADLPLKLITNYSYTIHCITKYINTTNWYKAIVDYIKLVKGNFIQFPDRFGGPLGMSIYLDLVKQNLNLNTSINDEKKDRLVDYLNSSSESPKQGKQTDILQLIKIYRQWVRIFPFDISYLGQFKEYFQSRLPIFCEAIETNLYTGMSSFKPVRKKKLLNYLKDITRDMLQKVNELEAFKNSKNRLTEQTQLELANAIHKLDQAFMVEEGIEDKPYWQLINKWLENEKKHIDRIREIIGNDYSTESFILNVLDGIRQLQSGGTNEYCINLVRGGHGDRESQVRNWFNTFLTARYKDSDVTAEEIRGQGHMDLKLFHSQMSPKIMEFKGWWNNDKTNIANQMASYLTDAEGEGFIFMINHLKVKEISGEYRELITQDSNGYITDTWKVNQVPNSAITYYESRHRSGTTEKTLYHFIFNAYF
ncbi:hypothetical protein ABE545_23980 [Sphingobacterium faecium]|uniref:hypothetical protein n=1 Tax=Sphingobacterium faecium TaxID=34087 RepID=UPI0032090121